MSTAELRKKVLKKIEQIDEDYLLEELLGVIEIETSDEFFRIPEEHIKDIEIGLAQIESGNTIPHEEVRKNVEKWLGK
jgi:hypothetical protein